MRAARCFMFICLALLVPRAMAQSSASGAADGRGPDLSPVIPSGSRAVSAGALQQNASTRARFGRPLNARGAVQDAARPGLFFAPAPPVLDRGGGGAFRPNLTYRSDLDAGEVVGPFPPGAAMNAAPMGGLTTNTFTPPDVFWNGEADQQPIAPAPPAGTLPRGVGLSNSLTPAPPESAPVMYESAPRPSLGIAMAPGFTGSGARVTQIAWDGPAARAGLRPGDVITSVNGMGVYHYQDVLAAMETVPASASIEVIAWRNSRSVPLIVQFAPPSDAALSARRGFNPSQTSASADPAERLARVEALMRDAQTELQQLREEEAAR